jgi:hypothetical protein
MKVLYIATGILAAATLLVFACSNYKPPILADIHCASRTDCRAASEKFNQVVHAMYPVGSNQDLLDRDLLSERFTQQHKGITRCSKRTDVPIVGKTVVGCPAWDTNWNPQHALWYWTCDVGEVLCNRYAGVVWSSDAQGHITYLQAYYEVTKGF